MTRKKCAEAAIWALEMGSTSWSGPPEASKLKALSSFSVFRRKTPPSGKDIAHAFVRSHGAAHLRLPRLRQQTASR